MIKGLQDIYIYNWLSSTMGNIPRVHKPTYWAPINKEAKMKFPTKTIETQMNFPTN